MDPERAAFFSVNSYNYCVIVNKRPELFIKMEGICKNDLI